MLGLELVRACLHAHPLAADLHLEQLPGQGGAGHEVLPETKRASLLGEDRGQPGNRRRLRQHADDVRRPPFLGDHRDEPGVKGSGRMRAQRYGPSTSPVTSSTLASSTTRSWWDGTRAAASGSISPISTWSTFAVPSRSRVPAP